MNLVPSSTFTKNSKAFLFCLIAFCKDWSITSKELTSTCPTLTITIPGTSPAAWAGLSSFTEVITTPLSIFFKLNFYLFLEFNSSATKPNLSYSFV